MVRNQVKSGICPGIVYYDPNGVHTQIPGVSEIKNPCPRARGPEYETNCARRQQQSYPSR